MTRTTDEQKLCVLLEKKLRQSRKGFVLIEEIMKLLINNVFWKKRFQRL